MVVFSVTDYKTLLIWFELAFAKLPKSKISTEDKKTFWKLTFLSEDAVKEARENESEEES
jgi:hypothetical protein|tara:strand:- start:311 stop:490 length:180 start_codon:yes stop_codon:yes gene_type:complete